MYNFIYGNVIKKELNFKDVLEQNFKNGEVIGSIIDITEKDKLISQLNAK